MGYTKVKGALSDPKRTRALEVEFLVDTGASYMVIPPSVARELKLESFQTIKATLADKREVEADYSFAYVEIMDREAPVPVLIMDSTLPLLGAFTLQVLGLAVDPVKEEVIPTRPFALGLL